MLSTITVWPGFTVEVPITKSVLEGPGVITMLDGPAVMVAAGGRCVVSWGSAAGCVQKSSQPVAEISMIGEHPLHGDVLVKFGSGIS